MRLDPASPNMPQGQTDIPSVLAAGSTPKKLSGNANPFYLKRLTRSWPSCFPIPVIRVAQIAFYPMQVRMDPCGVVAVLVLHELMRVLPRSFCGPPERL